jgi:aminocarboxymuconate-semialdehyde decarboxylase|tara:strand:+ start:1464 stop:2465 length:1002 start_codon:yes stop_codon:yes gene_type:complete
LPAPTIDIHCHLGTPAASDLLAPHGKPEYEPYDHFMGRSSRDQNAVMYPTIAAQLNDPAARIEPMDAMGVQIQGLATFVSQYGYWAPAQLAAEAARIQNDNLAQAATDHPDRFVPCGATVPLQDVELAIEEMNRAVDELGFKGLQIGGTVEGHNLDEPRFRPFWQAVAAKGVPVILHPNGYEESQRLDDYFLVNCIGNPLETTVAAHRMIFSGLFEELPNLKLVLLHGGGYLPFYAARADHTWEVRPETRVHIPDNPPSYYMKRLYYDTMVFQPLYLQHLIEIVGSARVMAGTDFPFDMGETDPMGLVDRLEGLADEEREAIKGANAARLFGI